MKYLVAIPVYNEQQFLPAVLDSVRRQTDDILVVDDGSTDATARILAERPDIATLTHPENRGYGQSLIDAFRFADRHGYGWVITIDCDEQHEPAAIPRFLAAAARGEADVISGSRYLDIACEGECPPEDRRAINAEITGEINARLRLSLTDAFCGFKAYRVQALSGLRLNVQGYAFPMQFWVQAVAHGLTIREIPVKLIYNDLNRTFGGPRDDPKVRLGHYREELHAELRRSADRLPVGALADVATCCQLG